jgi:hypothetical protein
MWCDANSDEVRGRSLEGKVKISVRCMGLARDGWAAARLAGCR